MGKLREMCRKALRVCREQKAATQQLESRVMRLERDKEILGGQSTMPSLSLFPLRNCGALLSQAAWRLRLER